MRMRGGVLTAIMVLAAVAATVGGRGVQRADAQPLANAGGSYTGVVGVPVTFNGSGSLGANASFTWVFSDGTTASGPVVAKTFTSAGTFTAQLTVADITGVATDTATVVVNPFGGTLQSGGCTFVSAGFCVAAPLTNAFPFNFNPVVTTSTFGLPVGPFTTVCNLLPFDVSTCVTTSANVAGSVFSPVTIPSALGVTCTLGGDGVVNCTTGAGVGTPFGTLITAPGGVIPTCLQAGLCAGIFVP